jgi:hypothetical protein
MFHPKTTLLHYISTHDYTGNINKGHRTVNHETIFGIGKAIDHTERLLYFGVVTYKTYHG